MRKMFSKQQLIEMIEAYSKASPEDIQKMFDDGEVSLDGKYVRIIEPPSSTTLTDEQIAILKEGVFVNGNFLGLYNPIILPAGRVSSTIDGGLIISKYQDANKPGIYFFQYFIQNKTISLATGNPLIKLYKSFVDTQCEYTISKINGFTYPVAATQNDVSSGDTITSGSDLDKALKAHLEVQINGHRCRFESEQESGGSTYIVYSSFGEVSATGKLTANIISYNKSTREISFNQMTFTPDA